MHHLNIRKLILTAAAASALCLSLCSCEEVFAPVENGTVGTNPYIYWDETVPPSTAAPETIPTEATVPQPEGTVGYVIGEFLNIRSGPGTDYETLGTLSVGSQVIILEQRIVGSATWGRTAAGWVSMNYISLGAQPSIVGTVTAKSLNVRSGPGTGYDTVDTVSKGDQVLIYDQTTVDGKTWGRTDGGWISLQYVSITTIESGSASGTTVSIGTVTGKTLNIRKGAGTGYDVVGTLKKGDEVTILEKTTSGGNEWGRISEGWISLKYVEITSTTTLPAEQAPTQSTVKDTSIIGTWVSLDEQSYFSGSAPSVTTWTFREDGSYTAVQTGCSIQEKLGWQSSSSGNLSSGTFQFNGSTLALTSGGEETSMSISIEGNIMQVHGHRTYSTMLRNPDVNALIKLLIRNAYNKPESGIQGTWMSLNQASYGKNSHADVSKWYFGSDGSFSETAGSYVYDEASGWVASPDTVVYSGYYYFDGSRLTLCYETATNATTWETDLDVRYSIYENVTISSDTISLTSAKLFFAKTDQLNTLLSKASA